MRHIDYKTTADSLPLSAICQLFRSANALHQAQFRTWALRLFDNVFSTDAALWATTSTDAGEAIDYSKALLMSLPEEFANASPVIGDPLRAMAAMVDHTSFKGGSFRTAELPLPARARYAACGIKGGIYARHTDFDRGVSNVIATFSFRTEPSDLTPETVSKLQALTYAVVDAASFCFSLHLAKAHGLDRRKASAICDGNELMIESQTQFAALVREAFPNWVGPRLPFSLPDGRFGKFPVGRLLVSAERFESLRLVRIWRAAELDRLTDREEELISHALQGLSDKEIASITGLSSSTISNRLIGAFRKLNVGSRQHLRRKYGDISVTGCEDGDFGEPARDIRLQVLSAQSQGSSRR